VERERTPEPAMAQDIQSHFMSLSLSNTAELLKDMDVDRSRKAINDWVRKANVQSEPSQSPNQIALGKTVIRINDQRFWLYPPQTPKLTTCFTPDSFQRPRQPSPRSSSTNCGKNTMSKSLLFPVDGAQLSELHSNEQDFDFRCVATEIATLSNGSSES